MWALTGRRVAAVRCARSAWSRQEERRDTVRGGLRVLDDRSHVHAYQMAVRLERAAGDEHVLDILGLAVGDELVDQGHRGGEVERARVDDDDVRLLAWGQRADLALHVEHFGASQGGGAKHLDNGRSAKRVERLGSLESDGDPHVVEHVGGVVGASVEPEADADPGVLDLGVAHDARREPHIAERVVGHGGVEAGDGGDVGVARVDEVGHVKVAAERERAIILEHLELVRRQVGDVLEQVDVKLDPEREGELARDGDVGRGGRVRRGGDLKRRQWVRDR